MADFDKASPAAERIFNSRQINGSADLIKTIAKKAAHLWDSINSIDIPPDNTEAPRLVALAKTDLESAVMWATKAISRIQPEKPPV